MLKNRTLKVGNSQVQSFLVEMRRLRKFSTLGFPVSLVSRHVSSMIADFVLRMGGSSKFDTFSLSSSTIRFSDRFPPRSGATGMLVINAQSSLPEPS